MKEKDLIEESIAFEDQLIKVVRPGLRWLISQNAG